VNNEQDKKDQQAHALYQSLPKDLPPPELDAQILKAAHQAVHGHAHRVVKLTHKKSTTVWVRPLAYAAVLVLCLGVVLRMQTEIPEAIQSNPELFYLEKKADEAIDIYPVKELQQAAPVASVAPATQAIQQKPVPAPEMSKKLARSLAPERVAEQKNKAIESNDEAQGAQPAASLMMDAASYEQAPVAATVLAEAADQKRESETPDVAVAEMLRLYHAGESQPLILKLQAFIAKYPQFNLPEELQEFALKNGLVKSDAENPPAK
jgi:hypothetical protein